MIHYVKKKLFDNNYLLIETVKAQKGLLLCMECSAQDAIINVIPVGFQLSGHETMGNTNHIYQPLQEEALSQSSYFCHPETTPSICFNPR